jgi:hypothetical protein
LREWWGPWSSLEKGRSGPPWVSPCPRDLNRVLSATGAAARLKIDRYNRWSKRGCGRSCSPSTSAPAPRVAHEVHVAACQLALPPSRPPAWGTVRNLVYGANSHVDGGCLWHRERHLDQLLDGSDPKDFWTAGFSTRALRARGLPRSDLRGGGSGGRHDTSGSALTAGAEAASY